MLITTSADPLSAFFKTLPLFFGVVVFVAGMNLAVKQVRFIGSF